MCKIAIVNQRYGLEVNGGSEYYTRRIAEKISKNHDVEIITTKALDYNTWKNHYTQNEEIINGIKVKRFPVRFKRKKVWQKIVGVFLRFKIFNCKILGKLWVILQGPYTPKLTEYIKANRDNYDVFIFVTYLYYPTVFGIKEVADKAIFVPTAHDEPYIYFEIFKETFNCPKAIMFLTEEEKKFVTEKFEIKNICQETVGIGIELPNEKLENRYEKNKQYLVYVGRVDVDKGCREMIEYFKILNKKYPELELIIVGKQYMEIERNAGIHYLGFLSEEDKNSIIKGAKALWIPSSHESLSIVALEAMSLSVPIIVNKECEVLNGHCIKSQAGLAYFNYDEFEEAIELLQDVDFYNKLCANGKKYVNKLYSWKFVMQKWEILIEEVI